jgi:hypothetical protein
MPHSTIYHILGPSLSYGSWIYNYLCNQCQSPLTLWVQMLLMAKCTQYNICDKICQWLATGRWFSPVSSTYKTDHHDIHVIEILLKVALNTITLYDGLNECWTFSPLGFKRLKYFDLQRWKWYLAHTIIGCLWADCSCRFEGQVRKDNVQDVQCRWTWEAIYMIATRYPGLWCLMPLSTIFQLHATF